MLTNMKADLVLLNKFYQPMEKKVLFSKKKKKKKKKKGEFTLVQQQLQ
jgi:hypothetical protein